MNNLQFTKNYNFTIMKKIYKNSDNTSAFYEAFDNSEKRKVGIKSLAVPKKNLSQAQTEAQMMNYFGTKTPNLPSLYTTYYDDQKERFYIVMQLIENGRTLEKLIEGRLPLKQGIQIMINLCNILIPIHQENYQHRDLKPSNIMVQKNNQVYLIDFNLSAKTPFKGEGTDHYRAPQQSEFVLGVGQDRVDIFSLGVMLYQLSTYQLPVMGQHYAVDREHKGWRFFKTPVEINSKIPNKLNDLIINCMSFSPKDRPQDANQLKRNLIHIIKEVR